MHDANKITGFNGYFAVRLRELMKNAEMTQQQLSKHIGVTRQTISQYADGSVQPNIERLAKIAAYFNVSTDFLLGLTNSMKIELPISDIANKLGLSEKAIKMLMGEQYDFVFGHENCNDFRDFVNIFADVNDINVDGINYDGYYLYKTILQFLKYQKQLPDKGDINNPMDTSVTLAAFRHEEPNGRGKMKFYKVLPTISEDDLVTVFLLEMQRELRALKVKLEEEKYFEDGGLAYRLKCKQDDDAVKLSIFKDYFGDAIDIEEAENYFEGHRKCREENLASFMNAWDAKHEERKNMTPDEWAALPIEEKQSFLASNILESMDKKHNS